ncbi:virulence protein RhuM/Fic/DOC family protein [Arenibacter algicola]|uniref:virulence protein RhuM/Fic/DOC family protein n=1 Tax=Arenibacter algicola TaxID=616991 RepID=UPI0004DEE922|nr:virulence protein RhuM/Fic/DOC family protein [Arenibacter algicola]
MNSISDIEIFQSSDGQAEVAVTFDNETVWLNQEQMSQLFERDRTVIGRHIGNIFREGELAEKVVCADFAHTTQHGAIEGKTQTKKAIYYNLDVIISVGYRIKSKRGTQFRQWASQRLKDYLIKGYTINQKRLEQTNQEIQILRSGIRILGRAIEDKAQEQGLQWLTQFAKGLTLLDDYDHERLDSKGLSKGPTNYPTKTEYKLLIDQMRKEFDSNLFGLEKDQGFDSAISQITKGFDENDFYPSIEEKAATLLYLITKNHAFTDGNKRIAAACFLMFLKKNSMLSDGTGMPIISNEALASVTLLVAASKPEEMEIVKKLIISILNRNKK